LGDGNALLLPTGERAQRRIFKVLNPHALHGEHDDLFVGVCHAAQ
jgi:hypothetical protein